MNFKNMSIKKSLIVGFGTTVLVSVAIIITSLIMMNSQKKAYSDILEHYVETITLPPCSIFSFLSAFSFSQRPRNAS